MIVTTWSPAGQLEVITVLLVHKFIYTRFVAKRMGHGCSNVLQLADYTFYMFLSTYIFSTIKCLFLMTSCILRRPTRVCRKTTPQMKMYNIFDWQLYNIYFALSVP